MKKNSQVYTENQRDMYNSILSKTKGAINLNSLTSAVKIDANNKIHPIKNLSIKILGMRGSKEGCTNA